MAAATSSPELFINCVGTFITEGDIGVGTIVGSAVFNVLAVPACCGLFAGQTIYLDWWPVTRDSAMYGVSVVALIYTLYDGIIMWYEGLGLVLAYIFYLAVIYCNDTMAKRARLIVAKCRRKYKPRPYKQVTEITPLFSKNGVAPATNGGTANGDRNGHGAANGNGHGNGVVHKSLSGASLSSIDESESDGE
jgi:solute carrier family 24 (sodium/potassium/calcium exchanger), member 4